MTFGPSLVTLGRPLGAGLLLGGLVLTALLAVGASWADLSAVTAERDAKADLLERGVSASRHARMEPASVAADPFVAAETATLAAARVDADLRGLAASSGLALLSSRAEAKVEAPGTTAAAIGTRIEDQAVVEGQNEALQTLLVKLETGTPVMLIDALAIEPAEGAEGALIDPQAPRLHVTLTLSAYWRPTQKAVVVP